MCEYLKRYFTKEEEFLDEFGMSVGAAIKLLGDEWKPDFHCNDATRQNRAYFLKTGQLNHLVFDGASVHHNEKGFSSVQIVLKSSTRLVNVRVKKVGDEFVAEKIIDRPADQSVT